jgi:hypothetical protein
LEYDSANTTMVHLDNVFREIREKNHLDTKESHLSNALGSSREVDSIHKVELLRSITGQLSQKISVTAEI